MDIKSPSPFPQPPPPPSPRRSPDEGGPPPRRSPDRDQGEGGPPHDHSALFHRFRQSRAFPIFSVAVVAVIVLGIGFAVVGLIGRLSGGGPALRGAPEAQNIPYKTSGEASLRISVLRASYQDAYGEAKPLAGDRKFAVLTIEIRNEGESPATPLTREDLRLIEPDGSILAPSYFSPGLLNVAIAPKDKRSGEVVWDVDPRNAGRPLSEFQIAFGKNPGSRALYPVTHETR